MRAYQHKYNPQDEVAQMAVAHAVAKKKSDAPKLTYQLSDKRPDSVIQLKTIIENTPQIYNYGSGSVEVGKSMEAWLDPNDRKKGWSANLNSAQNKMMSAIRRSYDIEGANVVKGHLLNDNLGGTALNKNLYPITGGANKAHLNYVENKVKDLSWSKKVGVYYRVNVLGEPSIHEPLASFENEIRLWDTSKPKDTSGRLELHRKVNSDLNKVREHDNVESLDGIDEPELIKRTARPSGSTPIKAVGALADEQKDSRFADHSDLGLIPFPTHKKTSLLSLNPKEHAALYKDTVSSMTDGEAAVHYGKVGALGGLGYGAYAAASAAAGTAGTVAAYMALASIGFGAAGVAGYGMYWLLRGKSKEKGD